MSLFCCCKTRRRSPPPTSSSRQSTAPSSTATLPTPPPPARLPSPPAVIPSSDVSERRVPTESNLSLALDAPVPAVPIRRDDLEDLEDLVVDDSDSDNDGPTRHTRPKSLSLDYVKTRIRRHLSSDSIRRRSRVAACDNEETVARRAELRRLMHKRIQEELQSEEASGTPSEQQPSTRLSIPFYDDLPGGGPRDNVEFSVSALVDSDRSRARNLDDGGHDLEPHLTSTRIDCDPVDLHSRRASCPDYTPSEHHQTRASHKARPCITLRSSLPQLASVLTETAVSSGRDVLHLESGAESRASDQSKQLDRRDVDSLPSAVNTEVRLKEASCILRMERRTDDESPGVAHHSRGSNHDLDVSPERDFLSTDGPNLEDQSPLSTWLRSQGLCSRSHSPTGSTTESQDPHEDDCMIHEAQVIKISKPPSTVHDLDSSIHRETVASRAVHLYDMDIHRQLRPGGPSTPSISPTRSPVRFNHMRGPSLITEASRISSLDLPPAALVVCEPSQENSTHSPNAGLETQTSSIYPSSVYSDGPGPVGSVPHLSSAIASQKAQEDPKRFQYTGLKRPSRLHSLKASIPFRTSSHHATRNTDSASSLPLPRAASKSPSSLASGASILHDGERQKPQSPKESVDVLPNRQRSVTPCVSKFREELGEKSTRTPAQKIPFFSRLHFGIPKRATPSSRRYDGPDDRLSQPWASTQTSKPSSSKTTPSPTREDTTISRPSGSRGHLSAGESAEELWQRAVQAEMRSRSLDIAKGVSKHPLRALGNGSSSPATPYKATRRSFGADRTPLSAGSSDFGQGRYSGSRQSPTNDTIEPVLEDDDNFHRSLVRSNTILHEWENQRREQEFEARARSRPIVQQKSPAHQLSEIPESWAKYPSHTRGTRSGSAGIEDHVNVRDFAVRSISPQGEIEWHTDQPKSTSERAVPVGRRSLSARMGQAFRTGINKLVQEKRSSVEGSSSKSKRLSCQLLPNGDLEYPELELLPTQGGDTELRALERDIDTLKGIQGLRCQPAPHTPTTTDDDWGSFQPIDPTTVRLYGSSGSDDDCGKGKMPLGSLTEANGHGSIPVTPDDKAMHFPRATGHTKDSTSTTIERYGTPLSQMSVYKDALSHRERTPETSRAEDAEVDSDQSETTVVMKTRR